MIYIIDDCEGSGTLGVYFVEVDEALSGDLERFVSARGHEVVMIADEPRWRSGEPWTAAEYIAAACEELNPTAVELLRSLPVTLRRQIYEEVQDELDEEAWFDALRIDEDLTSDQESPPDQKTSH